MASGFSKVAALMAIVREGEDTRLPAAARFALTSVADQIDTLADQMTSSNVPSSRRRSAMKTCAA